MKPYKCPVPKESRAMTPLEILYACLEIMGNHDRNHWKSGNQTSHQKSQFLTKFFLKYMQNLKYISNTCKILKYIYKYDTISLINDHLLQWLFCIGFIWRYQLQSARTILKFYVLVLNLDGSWMCHCNQYPILLEASVILIWVVDTSLATQLQSQSVEQLLRHCWVV